MVLMGKRWAQAQWFGWSMALSATVAAALVTPLARAVVVGGMDPITLLLARLAIAAVLMAITLAATDPSLLKISRQGLVSVTFVGVIAGIEISCFFWSLAWIDASMSAMLKSVQPLVVLLLLSFGGEPITRRHMMRLALAIVGIYLLIGPSGDVAPFGLLLTGISILLYGIQLVLIQWRLLVYETRTMTLYLLIVMTLVVGGWWGVQGAEWSDPGVNGWIAILVMAVVSTYFARIAQFAAVRHVGGGQVALLWPLQTLLIILLSVIFLQEQMSPIQWMGGGLILSSALLAIQNRTRIRADLADKAD
jgi:drug/metabolite transporter (DMT)-like permease